MFLNNIISSDDDGNDVPPLEILTDIQGQVIYSYNEAKQQKYTGVQLNQNYRKNLGQNAAVYDSMDIDMANLQYISGNLEQKNEENKQVQDNSNCLQNKFTMDCNLEILQLNSRGSINFEELNNEVFQTNKEDQDEKLQSLKIISPQFSYDSEKIEEPNLIIEQFQEKSISQHINQENQQKNTESKQPVKQKVQETFISDLLPMPPFSPYADPIVSIVLPDYLKQFLVFPLPIEGMFQCIIKRDKSGLNRFSPKFQMLWEKNYQFLIAARKCTNSRKYIVTQDQEFKQKDNLLKVGKVEMNEGNKCEYLLFDNGVKAQEVNAFNKKRKQLGAVFYDSKSDGPKRPRKIKFQMHCDGQTIMTFQNRQPQLKTQFHQNIYTLDFFGRVKKASVKNFQLVKRGNTQDVIFFQFGKVTKDIFAVDFCAPLSPLLAFQIALTNFDYKSR